VVPLLLVLYRDKTRKSKPGLKKPKQKTTRRKYSTEQEMPSILLTPLRFLVALYCRTSPKFLFVSLFALFFWRNLPDVATTINEYCNQSETCVPFAQYLSETEWFVDEDLPRYQQPDRPPGNGTRVAICAFVKNEAPYLREWLDFHLLMGVEKFYLIGKS